MLIFDSFSARVNSEKTKLNREQICNKLIKTT